MSSEIESGTNIMKPNPERKAVRAMRWARTRWFWYNLSRRLPRVPDLPILLRYQHGVPNSERTSMVMSAVVPFNMFEWTRGVDELSRFHDAKCDDATLKKALPARAGWNVFATA
jgi:hypothetical protein